MNYDNTYKYYYVKYNTLYKLKFKIKSYSNINIKLEWVEINFKAKGEIKLFSNIDSFPDPDGNKISYACQNNVFISDSHKSP